MAYSVLAEFPELTATVNLHFQPHHSFSHHIITNGTPAFARPRLLAGERLNISRHKFADFLEQGIIRLSGKNWTSLLNMAPKKDPNGWCPCGGYGTVKGGAVPHRYLLPHLHNFTRDLFGTAIYSKKDLIKPKFMTRSE